MKCQDLAELLFDYLNGELTPEQDMALQQHLDLCPPCIHLIKTYELTIQITRQLPKADIPPATAQRLQETLKMAYAQQTGQA